MYLSDGTTYRPGEGAERAARLRDTDLPADIVAMYVEDAKQSIALYGFVPGGTTDLFVADLILRGILTDRKVAEAVLGGPRS
jgi:hypothetical protein